MRLEKPVTQIWIVIPIQGWNNECHTPRGYILPPHGDDLLIPLANLHADILFSIMLNEIIFILICKFVFSLHDLARLLLLHFYTTRLDEWRLDNGLFRRVTPSPIHIHL